MPVIVEQLYDFAAVTETCGKVVQYVGVPHAGLSQLHLLYERQLHAGEAVYLRLEKVGYHVQIAFRAHVTEL